MISVFSVIILLVIFSMFKHNYLLLKYFNNIVKCHGRLIVKRFKNVEMLQTALAFFFILLGMNKTFILENIFCLITQIELFFEMFIFSRFLQLFCFVLLNLATAFFLFYTVEQCFFNKRIKMCLGDLIFIKYFFVHYARKGLFFSCKMKRVII